MKKFLEIIKKKWLIDNTKTIILVILLVIAFLFINIYVINLDLPTIDLTQNKLNSLTDESKEKIKDIKLNVSIYFFGIDDSYDIVDFAKQYTRVNDKISIEVVDAIKRPDLYEKYGATNSYGIVVQAPERFKILSLDSFIKDNKTIDISEQEFTNAIIDTTLAKKPRIYFLAGHDESADIDFFQTFLINEVNYVESLNLLSKEFPKDCDLLCIVNPQKDFSDYETNQIIDYINNGGNILWLSSGIDNSFVNIKKVLSLYGANIQTGLVYDSNVSNTFVNKPNYFAPTVSYHDITKSFISASTSSPLVALFDSSKIDTVSDEELNALNVTARPFLKTADTAYFRTDLSNTSLADGEQTESFNIGIEFNKTVNEKVSTLILYSDVKFATDSLNVQNRYIEPIRIYYNKDLLLNTTAYLTNREDGMVIRKSTNYIAYTANESEDFIIRLIIFIVPLIIILFGIIIWIIRRYKK